jgi:NAD(P)-dependent dehydrogenase (short-subunit alcohol dehydrogenase family)
MEYFKDKIAIVTGGASGIGRALCEELAQMGASVIIADINEKEAEKVVSAISESGGRAQAALLDVTRAEEVQKLIDQTAAEHGRLDFMFNNAGIAIVGEMREFSLETWQNVLGINLLGVIYGTTAAYSLMARQGFGHIVNTASYLGLISSPMSIPYGTAKFGVVGLSTSLRAEAADLGVKVSVACPGYIQTDLFKRAKFTKISMEDVIAEAPFKLMEVSKAAQLILQGVARNRSIIIFPFRYRFIWWLTRLHPGIQNFLNLRMAKGFREFIDDFQYSRSG